MGYNYSYSHALTGLEDKSFDKAPIFMWLREPQGVKKFKAPHPTPREDGRSIETV